MTDSEKSGKNQEGRHRRAARLAAVQALYEMAITNADVVNVLKEFAAQRWKGADEDLPDALAKPDTRFLGELVRGVLARAEDLDQLIGTVLQKNNVLERFEVLLRTILRAGAYELLERVEIPPRVVINEYLEVTHAFYAENEASLVNGILDKLAKKLRSSEMASMVDGAKANG